MDTRIVPNDYHILRSFHFLSALCHWPSVFVDDTASITIAFKFINHILQRIRTEPAHHGCERLVMRSSGPPVLARRPVMTEPNCDSSAVCASLRSTFC